jgi:hypothetical protein
MSYHPYQSAPLVPSGVSFFGQANGQDQLHEANNNFVYDSGLDLLHVGNITINDDGRIGNVSYPDLIELGSDGVTTVNSGVVIQGDLTVNGTQFISNTETVVIADNILLLNSGVTGTPTENAGLEVERGTECNPQLIWDENHEYWAFTACKDTGPYTPIGVARSGLVYDTTPGKKHIFDVGAGEGIRVNDSDIDVVVGHGLEIDNATNAVEAVAGTGVVVNADGIHVDLNGIVCANSGLTVTGDDCIGVLAGTGLLTNADGLHIGIGNGITGGADEISVTDGSGILVDVNGVHVNTGDGLEIISDEVRVKAGDAISLDNGEVNVDLVGENEILEPQDSDLLLLQRGGDVQKITFENLTDQLQSVKTWEEITASKGHDYSYKDVSLVNAGSNSIELDLPPAAAYEGKVLTFKRIDAAPDSTYNVKVDASGTQTIDDASFKRLYYRYEGINILSNGTNWFII